MDEIWIFFQMFMFNYLLFTFCESSEGSYTCLHCLKEKDQDTVLEHMLNF